jgi:hypothetical protein
VRSAEPRRAELAFARKDAQKARFKGMGFATSQKNRASKKNTRASPEIAKAQKSEKSLIQRKHKKGWEIRVPPAPAITARQPLV